MKHPLTKILMVITLLALAFSTLSVTPALAAGPFMVTKTADTNDGTCNSDCSLREAIIAANALAGNDTITVPTGTYTLTIPGTDEDAAATGDLDITSNITLNGAGAGSTIIQAGTLGVGGPPNGIDRVFHITNTYIVNISRVTIRNGNSAADGGGGINNLGTLTVMNSTLSGNSAHFSGGGINNYGTLTVTNSTLADNSADAGGGISNNGGTATITNSTLSGNSANLGGGIENGGTLTVTNSTLSGNSANFFGGGINNSGPLNYANTIIANSTTGSDCSNDSTFGIISTNTNNLVEDGSCSAALSGDPKLGPLASNGGPTQTLALLAGSKAIDAGKDSVCAAAPVSNKDQRGVTRPQGAHCDIGSYEKPTGRLTFYSLGPQDGQMIESSENGNQGGLTNAGSTTFYLGDDAQRRQYRGLLSFNTGPSLPDHANITNITLKFKKQAIVGGGNPVAIFQGFTLDIKTGAYGTTALQASDFQAAANISNGPYQPVAINDWYSIDLTFARDWINKLSTNSGLTQIRLRFNRDDNDNAVANYLSLYSGNAPVASRPQLVITYSVP